MSSPGLVRPCIARSRVKLSFAIGCAVLAHLLGASRASALDVRCDVPGADALGWAVTAAGDFDGDGTPDIAISAPCASVSTLKRAGRVQVYSGSTGARLRAFKGTKAGQQLGSALAFVQDRDRDGGDELAVGSFAWDTATLVGAGKLEIFNSKGTVLLSVEGPVAGANFGESIAVIPDLDRDGIQELLVGAGDDREGAERRGRAYLLSGLDGAEIDRSTGELKYDGWGSTVSAAPDIDGDSVADLVVGSNLADVLSGDITTENNGVVKLLSGADMTQVLMTVAGAPAEKLGESVALLGAEGFYAGAPGADVQGKNKAGSVRLFGWDGTELDAITDPIPAIAANFGAAVAAPGDLDADGIADVVVGAPSRTAGTIGPVGKVYALSGDSHGLLWSLSGERRLLRLGATLASTPDFDGDSVPDVLVSAPGDAPLGRRNAGTVRLVSGVDGSEIQRFKGRRGFETRLFIAGWGLGDVAVTSSFDRRGRRGELRTEPFRGLASGALSVAVLDAGVVDAGPNDLKIVIGTGHRATDDRVRIVRAGRAEIVSDLNGFDGTFPGGVSVAAGDVTGDTDEDLVVTQADSANGIVRARVYERLDPDPLGHIAWPGFVQFRAFDEGMKVQNQLVDADGANVAVGNVIIDAAPDKAELIVGPIDGAPVVRVLDGAGLMKAEWIAYPIEDSRGTSVAVGDLDGDGQQEIVTAPSSGLPWIRAFNGDGTPFALGGTTVSFFAYDTSFVSGLRVGVADVDLDGRGEILVATAEGPQCLVKAFEVDGTPVSGWSDFMPFGPACTRGVAIAGSDRYLRP